MTTYSAKPADSREEMGADRRRRAGRRPARLDRRDAAARQAQADLHARMSTDGDNVIVINAAKVVLTGRKREQKVYHHHTGFIGGIKERTRASRSSRASFPERIVEKAVQRMLPRGPLGRAPVRQSAGLSGRRASARRAAAGDSSISAR